MYKIVYTKQALKDIEMQKAANISQKAKILVDVIRENPYQNPPRYEKLVGKLDGILSRRINIQHRLVYQVYEIPFEENEINYQGTVKVIRMWTHYENVRQSKAPTDGYCLSEGAFSVHTGYAVIT